MTTSNPITVLVSRTRDRLMVEQHMAPTGQGYLTFPLNDPRFGPLVAADTLNAFGFYDAHQTEMERAEFFALLDAQETSPAARARQERALERAAAQVALAETLDSLE